MKRFDFNLGVEVRSIDEPCGKLSGVVVYPETLQVTDLIIQKGFLPLLTQERVLPLDKVQSAFKDNLHLAILSEEFNQYPEYRVKEYEEPATGLEQSAGQVAGPHGFHAAAEPHIPMIKRKIREGIAGGQLVIDQDAVVKNLDGTIGKVSHVIMERDDNKITHLVVKSGTVFSSEEVVISTSMIESVNEEGVSASITSDEVEQLARYTLEVEDSILTAN